MNKEKLNEISDHTVKRYSGRYNEFKKDIKTLGWGSIEQQEHRFKNVLKHLDLEGKSILDIGCGFGDLYNYLAKNNHSFSKYIGWDITPDFINDSSIKDKTVTLEVKNISIDKIDKPVADIGIMLGLLNWKFKTKEENIAYSLKMITNALKTVNDVLVVDFLSTNYSPDYPVEDFVFYHNPMEMFELLHKITPNIDLIHSYKPVPQKEFLLYIYK